MALTNIIREPQRELTETGMGLLVSGVVLGAVLGPSYLLASWFQDLYVGAHNEPLQMWFWMVIAAIIVFFGGWGILTITHIIGEKFCNNLANRGMELRPRERLVDARGGGTAFWTKC